MKKRGRPEKGKEGKNHSASGKGDEPKSTGNPKEDKKKIIEPSRLDEESENQGFGMWLRSTDGVEMMRLFVIANSLLVFVTMAWPNMQEGLSILKDYLMGEDD